jgi:hypothetical protein
MKETSLDEFFDDDTDVSEPSASGDSEPSVSGDSEPSVSGDSEPSVSGEPDPATARWTPECEACASCGDTVNRLWTDEGQRVCRDCKSW